MAAKSLLKRLMATKSLLERAMPAIVRGSYFNNIAAMSRSYNRGRGPLQPLIDHGVYAPNETGWILQ